MLPDIIALRRRDILRAALLVPGIALALHAQRATTVTASSAGQSASAGVTVTTPLASPLHRPWMVYAYTDFYFPNHQPTDTALLRLVASRADRLTNGDTILWRRDNARIEQVQYTLYWFVLTTTADTLGTSGVAPLDTFLVAHGFPIESAFLHRKDSTATKANRIAWVAQDGDSAAAMNPADSGFRAYRTQQLAALRAHGYTGVFYDVFGRGNMAKAFTSAEGDSIWYRTQLAGALRAQRAATGATVILNTSSYNTPFDSICIVAAGGAHLELTNWPLGMNLAGNLNFWRWIDHMTAAGAQRIEFVSNLAWTDKVPTAVGNDVTPVGREKMAEYASYLEAKDTGLVVAFAPDNYWTQSPATHWLAAWDTALGAPITVRALVGSGTDPVGQKYQVWSRLYGKALVLMRTAVGAVPTNYGDSSAVSVPFGTTGRLLRSDGTTTPSDSTVRLRAGEGVVVLTP